MPSLEELKKKIAMMQAPSLDSVTNTEVKDVTWKARIGCAGNRPEDWLEYINHLKADPTIKQGTVFSAYSEAIEAIDDRKHMENIHMVQLFLEYMELKIKKCPDEVEAMLKYARSTFRNFVIVHVEGAEFELKQGEVKKAERILVKSKQIKPRPYNMLLVAMRNLAEGQVQLLTQEEKAECLSERLLEKDGGTCSEDSLEEIQFSVTKQPSLRCGDKEDISDTMPLGVMSSQTKLHHYHSTPDCSKMTSQFALTSTSRMRRPVDKNIFGPPLRVKRNMLPSSETEEDMITEGFQLLDTSNAKPNESILRGSSSSSGQDSSGEIHFPGRYHKAGSVRFGADERKDDTTDTMPLGVMSSQTKLHHYHSTPDCSRMTGQSALTTTSMWRRPNSKNVFGVPLRVKRNTLPSAIEREERLFDSFQPLDESAREHDVFNTNMHSSGYLSMIQPDTSIAMESSFLNPLPVSHHQPARVDNVMRINNKLSDNPQPVSHRQPACVDNVMETDNKLSDNPQPVSHRQPAYVDNVMETDNKMSDNPQPVSHRQPAYMYNVMETDNKLSDNPQPVSHRQPAYMDNVTETDDKMSDNPHPVSHRQPAYVDNVTETDDKMSDNPQPVSHRQPAYVDNVTETDDKMSDNPQPVSHRQPAYEDNVTETDDKMSKVDSDPLLSGGGTLQNRHQKVKDSLPQEVKSTSHQEVKVEPRKVKASPKQKCFTNQVEACKGVSSTTRVETKIGVPTVGNISAPSCTPVTPSLANMEIITVNGQQYTKLNLIGKGGSAEVFHVFDSNRNSRAVKCVDLSNANDVMKQSYMNEIQLLQRLQYCESVIKMYDYEYKESENKLFVVMERAEIDLASFFQRKMKNKRRLDDKLVKFYWKEMLVAVEALHKEGIIHSDLKPANFILVAGSLKLIDFGIANAIQQDMTSVLLATPMGTPNYMSPETLMDSGGDCNPKHKINTKSDIWSLGCILYNMVYGKTPFQDIRNCWSKLVAIKDPNHVIELPPIQDENLMDVLRKCLNRDPKKRPSATELLSHAYLMEVTSRPAERKQGTPVAASDVKRLLVQFSESSPRTIQALTKNLLAKLNSGQKIDLGRIEVKSELAATTLDS